jgi:hypothetical protein
LKLGCQCNNRNARERIKAISFIPLICLISS